MKLEEQLDKLIPIEFGGEMQEPLRSGCVQIADNHAIGFIKWYKKLPICNRNGRSIEELLEIYKETL